MLYRRECDTLDASMCSSFYYLRYPDSANQHELISPHLRDVMMPIELYIGGKEHTV
jgi:leucyl-tRNA synthetase